MRVEGKGQARMHVCLYALGHAQVRSMLGSGQRDGAELLSAAGKSGELPLGLTACVVMVWTGAWGAWGAALQLVPLKASPRDLIQPRPLPGLSPCTT